MNIIKWIFAVLSVVMLGCFLKNIFSLIFSMGNESLHRKRLNSLKFTTKRTSSDADSQREFINKMTNPVATHLLPKVIKYEDMSQLERDLEMSQWNKMFTPVTFVAMKWTLRIIGVVLFIIFLPLSWKMGLLWFLVLFFAFGLLFRNSINERKFRILTQFPDFIRIAQGFLVSGMPLVQAIENSLPYVGDEWKALLQEFVINSEVYGQSDCIDKLTAKIDIFEVRELWSYIKLNNEQGINIKDCFSNQAEKVREMQLEVMLNKIGKRQIMSIAIQGPLLLTMIISFGLPTFYQMMNTF